MTITLHGVMAHPSITEGRILDAVRRGIFSLDNPGFCIACGDEHMQCEPDAERYRCERCGTRTVYGADFLLILVAP